MTSQEIMQASVLDILFENRNKTYGAYHLRKYYQQRMLLALSFSFSFVFLLVLFLKPGYQMAVLQKAALPEEVVVRTVEIEKQPEVLPPVPPTTPVASTTPVAQVKFNQILITANPVNNELVPTQDEMGPAAISNLTATGIENSNLPPVLANNTGNGTEGLIEKKAPENFIAVEAAPEFPGGDAAWLHFLSRHLRSPDELSAGEKKTVMVRFFVSKDGSVNNFEIVQSGGGVFDNEVIRVLKKMPKWKPALQNGQAVAVAFTQPVTFVGVEE